MKRRIAIALTIFGLLLGFTLWGQGRRAQAKAPLAAPAAMAGAITLAIDPGADNAGDAEGRTRWR